MPEARVKFEPYGVEAAVPRGSTVLEAARAAGIAISAPCGGRGTCGKCAVRVLSGRPAAVRAAEHPVPITLPPGMVLACLAEVSDGLVVRPVNARREVSPGCSDGGI